VLSKVPRAVRTGRRIADPTAEVFSWSRQTLHRHLGLRDRPTGRVRVPRLFLLPELVDHTAAGCVHLARLSSSRGFGQPGGGAMREIREGGGRKGEAGSEKGEWALAVKRENAGQHSMEWCGT